MWRGGLILPVGGLVQSQGEGEGEGGGRGDLFYSISMSAELSLLYNL